MYEFGIIISYMAMLAVSIWFVLYYGQVNQEKDDVEIDDTKVRYNLRNIPRVNYKEESSEDEWDEDEWEEQTWETLKNTDDESREKLIAGLNALSDRRGRTISDIVAEVLG